MAAPLLSSYRAPPELRGSHDRIPAMSTSSAVVRTGSSPPLLQARLSNRRSIRYVTRAALSEQQLSSEQGDEKLSLLDTLFLDAFRVKMKEEIGWESSKAGFEGLLEEVNHLYTKSSKPEVEKATLRVFTSLLPNFGLQSFRNVILPIANGKPAAVLMAVVTQATTEWLMGPSVVNRVTLADGSSLSSGVLVERCKFLEGSRCAGICTHMCKIPTQAFFKDVMGVPLAMEPNFEDFSCQFNIGTEAPPRDQDPAFQTPCLSICPTAAARSSLRNQIQTDQCPQVQ